VIVTGIGQTLSTPSSETEAEKMQIKNIPSIMRHVGVKNIIKKGISTHKFITIEVSLLCNYKCQMCIHGWAGDAPKPNRPKFMEKHNFFQVIDALSPYSHIIFMTGWGETFLHPDIYEMIAYASKNGIIVKGDTNGSHIDVQKLLDSRMYEIQFSMDGFSQASYEQYRKNGNFKRVIDNIIALSDEARKDKSDIHIVVKYLKNRFTAPEYPSACEFFKKYPNITFVCKPFICPPPSWKFLHEHDMCTTKEIFDYWSPVDTQYTVNDGIYCPVLPTCNIDEMVFITTNGDAYACCLAARTECADLLYGNIFQNTFMEIWNGLQRKTILKNVKNNPNTLSCRRCPYKAIMIAAPNEEKELS
jgi:radical SAM protein with 4Fe4S-binding SPASM domain